MLKPIQIIPNPPTETASSISVIPADDDIYPAETDTSKDDSSIDSQTQTNLDSIDNASMIVHYGFEAPLPLLSILWLGKQRIGQLTTVEEKMRRKILNEQEQSRNTLKQMSNFELTTLAETPSQYIEPIITAGEQFVGFMTAHVSSAVTSLTSIFQTASDTVTRFTDRKL